MICSVVAVSLWCSGCALEYYCIKVSLYFEPANSSCEALISSTAVFIFPLCFLAGFIGVVDVH